MLEPKTRPILFKGAMVRAILSGQKTQTRRIMKHQPRDDYTEIRVEYPHGRAMATYRAFPDGGSARWGICECPYGKIGDRLYVREQFGIADIGDSVGYVYRATDPDWQLSDGWKWRPSIHMPRAASRITLEITGVRVERVADISEGDAYSEGVVLPDPEVETYYSGFKTLWKSINGEGSWEDSPWVWCITFRRLTP